MPSVPHWFAPALTFIIPLLGLVFTRAFTRIVIRQNQWQAWFIQQYNALYSTQPTLIQASALMTMAVPVLVFLFAQRAFMRGVVITGVEK